MKIMKLSLPGIKNSESLSQYLGNNDGVVDGWRIVVGDDVKSADAWWVIESPLQSVESCQVPEGMLFFGSAEATWPIGFYSEYNYRTAYLNQFDEVHTCHDFYSTTTTSAIPFLPWMVNANHGGSIFSPHVRDIKYLSNIQSISKSKKISVFCSNQAMLPSHRLRIRFTRALKDHFGDDLDWFGNGSNSIAEKWDGLSDYMFSIVLENQARHNVITEKIMDPFLSLTYPIYWGAPNISSYFNPASFTPINIEDLKGAIQKIEHVLNNVDYADVLPMVIESRNRVLDEHHFVKRMVRIAEQKLNSMNSANRRTRLVREVSEFYHMHPRKLRILESLKNKGARTINRFV
jgi:Glycosyltransferase family 10 (fucosyltransferase) C-term